LPTREFLNEAAVVDTVVSTARINPQFVIHYLDQSFFWAARNIRPNYEMYKPCSSWFSTSFEFYVVLGC
jgi:hypothetical protein